MDLVNNKEYIVEEIERAATLEIERLKSSFEKERAALDEQAKAQLDEALEIMRKDHQYRIEAIRKRYASEESLATKRIELEGRAKLHERLVRSIKRTLEEDNETSRRIATSIVEDLRTNDTSRIVGPKWIAIEGVEPTLDSFEFHAHEKNAVLEVTFDDVLERLEPIIKQVVG